MHRARQRVEFGVVLAGGFAEAAGRGRKFVPEAIEVDALATGDQPLHVRAAKAEVPKQGILEDFFPWPDAWERRVDQDEARNALRKLRGESVPHHIADIVRDEIRAFDLERIEYASHIVSL